MLFRHVAPSGAPISLADLGRWVRHFGDGSDPLLRLTSEITGRFGARRVFLTNTGRAGLTVAFRALRTLVPSRGEVVLPSYTCFSVAASAVKAGLKVRIVDIDPATLDYDWDELEGCDFRHTLALVATNLYGYPSDAARLRALCQQHGMFLVDDAAQAMGATVGGRPSGTWGDVGLFSFDKGKNVSAIDGGVVVAQSEAVAGAIERLMASVPALSGSETMALAAKLAAYVTLLRPELYWIPNGIPGLGLGQTVYTTEIPLARMPAAGAALAHVMLGRLEEFTSRRTATSGWWQRALEDVPGLQFVRPRSDASAAFLRLPLLEADASTKEQTILALRQAGIGATGSYPSSLADVPGLQPHLAAPAPRASGGRTVASRIVTLPTHPMVTERDVRRGAAAIVRSRSAGLFAVGQKRASSLE